MSFANLKFFIAALKFKDANALLLSLSIQKQTLTNLLARVEAMTVLSFKNKNIVAVNILD
eukprot:2684511-Pleurochrysis_carterae.AAC.2